MRLIRVIVAQESSQDFLAGFLIESSYVPTDVMFLQWLMLSVTGVWTG